MTLTPTQIAERAEKARATARARALTLEMDGYRIEAQDDTPGIYQVYLPEPTDERESYEVDLFNESCTCIHSLYHGECKHLLATRAAVLKAIELTAPLLPLVKSLREGI